MAFCLRNLQKLVGANVSPVRKYARWSHRTPRKVIMPEGLEKAEVAFQENSFGNEMSKTAGPKVQKAEKSNVLKTSNKEIVASDINDDKYIKEKRKEAEWRPKFGDMNKPGHKGKSKKLPQSKKLSIDMLETVIDREGNFVYTKLKDNDATIGTILVGLKSNKWKDKNELILLEGKRLIKEALVSGCKLTHLVFSRKDEVDYLLPFLPKSGSKLYKMPYREMQLWSDLTTCPGIMGIFKVPESEKVEPPKNHLPLTIICDNIREPGNLGAIIRCSAAIPCEKLILTAGCAHLWDTKVTRSSAGSHFKIPIHKKIDWAEMRDLIPSKSNVYIADNKTISKANRSEQKTSNSELVELIESMPVVPYFSPNFDKSNQSVLIIGGETEGISEESYIFTKKNGGIRINIPLHSEIDSLNTGTALGIILFEMKRQMLLNTTPNLSVSECVQ